MALRLLVLRHSHRNSDSLLLFAQPFGFNAILGLIGLAGILMRNTLILIGQIDADRAEGMGPREGVIEATVRRARPMC